MPRKVKYDPNFVLTPEIRAYIEKFGYGKASEEYGQSYQRLYYLYHKEEKPEEEVAHPPPFHIDSLPDDEPSADELIQRALDTWRRKKIHHDASSIIPVQCKESGPFGIAFVGDPHIDDMGCNWEALLHDLKMMREANMLGICVGDITNNWVGRLMKKYADQETTRKQAIKLIEWFFKGCGVHWLAIIGGNHDIWNTDGGDVNQFMFRQEAGVYKNHGVRLKIQMPNNINFKVNCRHDYTGHSQWNEAHAMSKAARFGDDDVYVAGHRHNSAYQMIKRHETGRIAHAVRVSGYKEIDDFAEQKGFRDHTIFRSMVFIVDPTQTDPLRFCKPVFDMEEAKEEILWKKKKK